MIKPVADTVAFVGSLDTYDAEFVTSSVPAVANVAIVLSCCVSPSLMSSVTVAGVTAIVHEMAGGLTGGAEAAHAIMTTDTVPKAVSRQVVIDGVPRPRFERIGPARQAQASSS